MTIAIDATTGRPRSLVVNSSGELLTVGSGGAGGDASAANQTAQLALMPTPVDSTGLALPADFDTLATTFGYTGDNLTTIVKTKGANTWTQTLAYTGANLTSMTKWVKA